MIDPLYLVLVTATVVVVLSAVIVGLAYRAARRSDSRQLRLFGAGFGLITVGTLTSGSAAALADLGVVTALLLQACSMAVGLLLLVHSLYGDVPRPLTGAARGQ